MRTCAKSAYEIFHHCHNHNNNKKAHKPTKQEDKRMSVSIPTGDRLQPWVNSFMIASIITFNAGCQCRETESKCESNCRMMYGDELKFQELLLLTYFATRLVVCHTKQDTLRWLTPFKYIDLHWLTLL